MSVQWQYELAVRHVLRLCTRYWLWSTRTQFRCRICSLILPILNKHVDSEPCHSIHAHESCMHVAVRVLHSSAFIAFCTHAALHVVGVGHCMNVAVNINWLKNASNVCIYCMTTHAQCTIIIENILLRVAYTYTITIGITWGRALKKDVVYTLST